MTDAIRLTRTDMPRRSWEIFPLRFNLEVFRTSSIPAHQDEHVDARNGIRNNGRVSSVHHQPVERILSDSLTFEQQYDLASRGKTQLGKSTATSWQGNEQLSSLHEAPRHRPWRSIWLSKVSLTAFTLVFTAMWMALLILRRASHRQNGFEFDLSASNNRYFFKFGPTAVLVLVACFWRQVDYNCKLLQPWSNMRDTPSSPARSVLLDYISPLQIVTLFRAIQYRNPAVVITIVTFVSLKVAVIFSTSLLVVSSVQILNPSAKLSLQTSFRDLPDNVTVYNRSGSTEYGQGIDVTWKPRGYAAPVQVYEGILSEDLTPPSGIIDNLVTQQYTFDEDHDTASAVVRAFQPQAHCEIGTVLNADDDRGISGYGAQTSTCRLPSMRLDDYHPEEDHQFVRGFVNYLPCSTRSSSPHFDVDDGDWRWILAVTNDSGTWSPDCSSFSPNEFPKYDLPENTDCNFKRDSGVTRGTYNISVVLCDIDYKMMDVTLSQKRDVTGFIRSEIVKVAESKVKHFTSFSETRLNQVVARALGSATSIIDHSTFYARNLEALFYLFELNLASEKKTAINLFEPGMLKQQAEAVFNNISQLVVQKTLLVESQDFLSGSLESYRTRLQVRELSFWIMFSLLLLSSLGCLVFLAVALPSGAVSCNPSTILTYAKILRASDSHSRQAFASVNLNTDQFGKQLDGYLFEVQSKHGFSLSAKYQEVRPPEVDGTAAEVDKRTPIILRSPTIACTVTVTVSIVVLLEGLQIWSDHYDGIASIKSTLTNAYFSYTTSVVMLGIAAIYNWIDFTTMALSPFGMLCKQPVAIQKNLNINLVATLPIIVLFKSFRSKQFKVLMSNTAAILGSTLTIFGSTLWNFDLDHMSPMNGSLIRTDVWNLTSLSTEIFADNHTLGLVLQQNLKDPWGTAGGLVFPHLLLDKVFEQNAMLQPGVTQIEVELPALRGKLECDIVSHDAFRRTYTHIGPPDEEWIPGCLGNYGKYRFRPYLTGHFGNATSPDIFLARLFVLDLRPAHRGSRPVVRCPSIALMYGHADFYGPSEIDWSFTPKEGNLTILHCYQGLEEITTRALVSYDSHLFDSQKSSPEIRLERVLDPIESSSRPIRDNHGDIQYFSWDPSTAMLSNVQEQVSQPDAVTLEISDFDLIFRYLLQRQGFKDSDVQAFMGAQNVPKLEEAFAEVWGLWVAQNMNQIVRTPIGSSEVTSTGSNSHQEYLPATAYFRTKRVQVSRPSKLVLQIILAIMVLSLCTNYYLTFRRAIDLLPNEPCSIASMMALIANSDLMDHIPELERADHMSNKEGDEFLKQSGWKIGMGWWNHDGQTKKFRVNDKSNRDLIAESLSSSGHFNGTMINSVSDRDLITEVLDNSERYNGDMRTGWKFGIDIISAADDSRDDRPSTRHGLWQKLRLRRQRQRQRLSQTPA